MCLLFFNGVGQQEYISIEDLTYVASEVGDVLQFREKNTVIVNRRTIQEATRL